MLFTQLGYLLEISTLQGTVEGGAVGHQTKVHRLLQLRNELIDFHYHQPVDDDHDNEWNVDQGRDEKNPVSNRIDGWLIGTPFLL